jgi:hypothetical protein
MASSLGLNFYDDEIRSGCYRPQLHCELENMQQTFLINSTKALENGKLHIVIDQLSQQQNFNKKE